MKYFGNNQQQQKKQEKNIFEIDKKLIDRIIRINLVNIANKKRHYVYFSI